MQSLALPRPTSFLTSPRGHPIEPEDGLVKFRARCSPSRAEQQSYPSPPMSEPHSPSRRPAHTSEPSRTSYHASGVSSRGPEAGLPLPPPSPALFDPRPALATQAHHQRQVYAGEQRPREQQLHNQPGRTIEQSPFGSVHALPDYTYGFQPTAVPRYAGGHHAGPTVQQGAMIPPPPARPIKPARRTKAHVASACVNCKKAHLSCDVQRPCGRCVSSGKQDTCKDVQHKKRGRPRLRDDREFSRPEDGTQLSGQILGAIPASAAEGYPQSFSELHPQRSSDPARYSARHGGEHVLNMNLRPLALSNGGRNDNVGVASSSYIGGPNLGYHKLPVAFLNLDLVIQKSNRAFQDLVSFLGDVRGKHLGDILESREDESLQRLRNALRDERDVKEPTYMAPITPVGQDPMQPVLESLADQDIDRVSHGFTDRLVNLGFRAPGSQYQSLQVQVRLAKTSLYFVTLVVRTPPRLSGPPLLAQQFAPPNPNPSAMAMAAPTTVAVRDFTPHQTRPQSSTSSTPNSPYFNFASVRTSLPTFSPSSYGSSPTYGYSPTAGAESGYFPTLQPPSQLGPAHPSPFAASHRNPSVTSEPLRELNRPARLEGLHLPPIRTGPAPLGSPLHFEGQRATERERDIVRRRVSSPQAEGRRPETPDKRRRLNIHEVLE